MGNRFTRRPSLRALIPRVLLILGMIGPGLLLLLDPSGLVTTSILSQVLGFPSFFIAMTGALLIFTGIVATFFQSVLDFCYIFAATFFALIFIASMVALFEGLTISALFLAEPVLIWVYVEATVKIAERRERNGSTWDEGEDR